ncbi:Ribonuclease/ribotoxin [Mucidula mucida]|nr:Ribonuclease/ribotoxin [Mucidula mucida]
MVQLFSLAITAILAAVSVASPIEITPRGWPLGSVNCGGAVHSLSAVMSATSSGFAHVGRPIGSNSYPHAFNNFEGLKMWCPSSEQSSMFEYPILSSGTYSGGSPGADRVIFSSRGTYCAVVTHTGASGNNFVSCAGD